VCDHVHGAERNTNALLCIVCFYFALSFSPLYSCGLGFTVLASPSGINELFGFSSMILQEGWYDDRPRSFLVYAPCRTAVVYALADVESEPVELSVGVESEPVQQSVEGEP
jgi:hypothetical protein